MNDPRQDRAIRVQSNFHDMFALCNVCSLFFKRHDVGALVDTCGPQKLFLAPGCPIHSKLFLLTKLTKLTLSNNYNTYRQDRLTTRGDGVMLSITKPMSSNVIATNLELEILWYRSRLNTSFPIFGVCYRPLKAVGTFVDWLNQCIESVISRCNNCPVILAGDFNFPGINLE